jgi:hypothetical protein
MTEISTIIRARLDEGRAIADEDVRALLNENEKLLETLKMWTTLQRSFVAKLAWEVKLEGIAQALEDAVGDCPQSQVEAYLRAANIVRKAKETTND